MRVLIATGGTGGHIYPSIAVARAFERCCKETEILFTITGKEIEVDILSKEGFKAKSVPASIWYRRGFCKNLIGCGKILWGVVLSVLILVRFKPDILLLMGGYMSVPVALAGCLTRRPMIVHEQNLLPGMAVRLLSRFADRVAVSYADTLSYLPERVRKKAVVTGNPVRYSKDEVADSGVLQRDTLLVFGGSQGASVINDVMIEVLKGLRNSGVKMKVLFVTGKRDFDRVSQILRRLTLDFVEVVPYCYNMADAMSKSRLVVSRAGASTVSELAFWGRASILIPFGRATDDHQYFNARVLERRGAALVIREEELTPSKLLESIVDLFSDADKIASMEMAAREVCVPDAAENVVRLAKEVSSTVG